MISLLIVLPLWNERPYFIGQYFMTVERGMLYSTTLFDLYMFVFPPNIRTDVSLPGFFITRAP